MQQVIEVALNNALVAAILGVAVFAISRICRRAALIHSLWLIVLAKLVAPPLIAIPLPIQASEMPSDLRLQVSLAKPGAGAEAPRSAGDDSRGTADTARRDEQRGPVSTPGPVVDSRPHGSDPAEARTVPIQRHAAHPGDDRRPGYDLSLGTCLVAIWIVGACWMLLRTVAGILQFRRLLKFAEPPDPAMQHRIGALAAGMGMKRVPACCVLPGEVSPMLWTFGWRARLILPRQLLDELSETAQETVFVHELAHYRRGDHWVRGLELVVSSLYWWHPVVWLAQRELRQVEEVCCDAWVVSQLPELRSTYARTLVQTIAFVSARPSLVPAVAGVLGKGIYRSIEERISSIMSDSFKRGVKMSVMMRVGLVLLAIVVLPLVPMIGDAADSPEATPGKALQPPANEPTTFAGSAAELSNVAHLALSPDGRFAAAGHGLGGGPGAFSYWDLEQGTLVKSFPEPRQAHSVSFSPDGKFVAYGSWHNLVRVRRTDSLTVVHEFIGLGFYPKCTAFSSDGKLFAVGQEKVQLYDTGTWAESAVVLKDDPMIADGALRITKIDFTADGRCLASGGGVVDGKGVGRTVVWELKSGEIVCTAEQQSRSLGTAFSPDGKRFAMSGENGRLQVHDATSGELLWLGMVPQTPLYDVNWSPDGKRIVVAAAIRGYAIFDAFTGELVETFGRPTDAEVRLNVAVHTPDGSKIITGSNEKRITVWDAKSKEALAEFPSSSVTRSAEQPLQTVAVSPDGRWIVTGSEDTTITLHKGESGASVKTLTGHKDLVSALAFAPGGLLASGSYDETIKLWKVPSGEQVRTLSGHDNWVFDVAFSPDGSQLASCGYDKSIRLWNVATGEQTAIIQGHEAAVRAVAYSPDGKRLASASSDQAVKVWDVADQKEVAVLKGHSGAVRDVAFSLDGKWLASASEDQTSRVWNTKDWSQRTLEGRGGIVMSLAFSAGSRNLATGGFDRTIRIWDPETGQQRQTLQGHRDAVSAVVFAPDTSSLISAGLDRTLRFWQASVPSKK